MGTPERIYELVKTLPEHQAAEILDFAEFLLQKRSHQQATENAKATNNPLLDFRQAAGLGQEVWQGVNVEQYIQQERAAWE